ncbi:Cysteine--tRNA ligase [Frankliniella fusca]|uniref:Cysteine--tRNA ligase n=1 Tax=Frankliniella fusca TaxID=407009 RepID=A0AAE1H8G0_9NEOP|nr:Cysteine--tRNA ligase [Frankliniella fusca]
MPRAKNGRFAKAQNVAKVEKLVERTAERKKKRSIAKAAKLLMAEDEPTMLVAVGRRVVELDTLAKELWCSDCNIPLSLRNLEKEQQMGLASIMTVRCGECLAEYAVHTSKKVPNLNGGKDLYSSNCKAALGCIDSGMGPEILKKFLSTLNIPVLHTHTYQRAHDFISEFVVKAADESCKEAIEKEKRLALELLLEKGTYKDMLFNSEALCP